MAAFGARSAITHASAHRARGTSQHPHVPQAHLRTALKQWRAAALTLDFGCVVVLAFSNGFVGTLAMSLAPQAVDPNIRPLAATLMTVSLNAGLVVGACLAFFLEKALLG
eukprot:SAG31_NODE_544_length_14245_cov_68.376644_3_plen_110_part_00